MDTLGGLTTCSSLFVAHVLVAHFFYIDHTKSLNNNSEDYSSLLYHHSSFVNHLLLILFILFYYARFIFFWR